MKKLSFIILIFFISCGKHSAPEPEIVSQNVMQKIYNEIRTPYKYGIVLKHPDANKMVDSPTIFRSGETWYMMFIVFDGTGYESWLAESSNLLDWQISGRILSFTSSSWDANQKAGYPALVDHMWGGSYELQPFQGKYWMSYLGGGSSGYEKGMLGVGIAFSKNPFLATEWTRLNQPVLLPNDPGARWFENQTIYKSSIIYDRENTLGFPFVMFYNAKNKKQVNDWNESAERIGMAVSRNMIHWKRFGQNPVIDHQTGISGDAQITKIGKIWVMFYFGAFWKPGAFERFACSTDLVNWTKWEGEDLISPSRDFDNKYAHKPWVIKHNRIVYHFYCAVGKYGRVIALATSKDLGKSKILSQLRIQK